jgi:hypothetical protein
VIFLNNQDVSPDTLELIRITDLCEAFGTLPQTGGVLDQDYLLIQAMGLVMQVKSEKLKKDQDAARR